MGCDCGKPKCNGHCGVSPAVLQINNPSECVLFHKVEVPASMGDSTTNPPKPGAYKNTLLYYKADGEAFLYSSDGMPTKITGVASDYACLENKPQINGVTLEGNKSLDDIGVTDAIDNALEDYTPTSELAEVATSGSYNDLSNKPTIPAAQVNSDWDASSGVAQILNKPTLAAVATSGNYDDLSNKPTIPAAQVNSDWNAASGVAQILNKPSLATVATSGSYNDLTNKPTIPTVNNATLTIQKNGTNVQTFTANQSTNATANITVPTKTSDLTNDGATGASVYIEESDITPSELSGEGELIALDGTTDCSALDTQLLGNAEQTTYSGKNLVDFAGNTLASHNGLTITSSFDGTIKWTGTPSANWANITSIIAVSLPAGTYTFSTTTTSNHRIYVHLTPSYDFVIEPSHTSVTHTFTSAITAIQLDLSGLSTSTNYNESVKLMLESGSTATAYEPYVGGTPAPNPSYPQPISTVTGAQTITVTGKNLFDGILENGSYYTETSLGNRLYNTATIPLTVGKRYTVSLTGDSQNLFCFAVNMDNQPLYKASQISGSLNYDSGWKTGSFSFTATYPYMGLIVARQNNGDLTPSDLSNCGLQLELGSQASDYQAYQGQQDFEVNLGKNLLDPSWMVAGYMGATGGTITYTQTQGEMACEEYIPVEPNTEYTFEIFETTDTYPEWFGISQYSTADTSGFVERSVKTGANPQTWFYTIRTKTNTHYIRPSARNLQHATKYMLSKGSRTTYEPYFELAKIGNYQDRIYKDDGKWYIEKQIEKATFDGSNDESWALGTTGSLRYPFGIDTVGKGWASSSIDGVMCDTFTLSTSSETGIAEQYQFTFRGTSYNNRLWFFCPKSAITGSTSAEVLASYKTFLSTHPTTVYYALATPTTTEITNEALIGQLEALAGALGYDGVTNIISTSPGLPAILSVSTYTGSAIPPATRARAGIVRIGDGIDVDDCGTISVNAQKAPTVITIDLGNQDDWSVVYNSLGPMLALGAGSVSSSQYDNRVRVVSLTPPTSTTFHNENTDTDMTLEEVFNLIESGEDVVFNNVPVGTYYDSRSEVYYPLGYAVNGVRVSDKLSYSDGAAFTGHVAINVPSPQSLDTQWDYNYPIVASISIRKLVVINGGISTTSYYLDVDGIYDGIVAD